MSNVQAHSDVAPDFSLSPRGTSVEGLGEG